MLRNIFIFCFSVVYFSCNTHNSTISEIPNIRGKLLNGDSTNLTSIATGKVALVNVWGIFCGPCIKELPILQTIYKKYKKIDDFAFVSLAMDSENELLDFLNSKDTINPYRNMFIYSKIDSFALPTLACLPHGYSNYYGGYAIVQDSTECRLLQNKINSRAIPNTFIFNRSGKLIFKQIGSFDDSIILTKKIDSLLQN